MATKLVLRNMKLNSQMNNNQSDIMTPYNKFTDKLETQGLLTSFGQMILSKNDTRPQYKFSRAQRQVNSFTQRTDYLYTPTAEKNYKYSQDPKWKFGSAPRDAVFAKERYDYYDQPYSSATDSAYINKKWTKPPGGDIGCEKRLLCLFKEKSPGPGRYNPNYESVKEKKPSYGIGLRLAYNSIMVPTGTNAAIAPGTYDIAEKSHLHKFSHSPKSKFGTDNRKPLNPKKNMINDTYFLYSSMGTQVNSPKNSNPSSSFGKADRFQKVIEKY